jgi:hypothetical protein
MKPRKHSSGNAQGHCKIAVGAPPLARTNCHASALHAAEYEPERKVPSISLGAAFSGAQEWRAVNAGLNVEDAAAPNDGAADVEHVRPTRLRAGLPSAVAPRPSCPAKAHTMPAYARTGIRLATVSIVAGLMALAGTATHTATDASLLAADSQAQANEATPVMAAALAAGQQTPAPTAPEAGPGADSSPFSSSEPRDSGTLVPSTPRAQRPAASKDAGLEPSISPVSTTTADPAAPSTTPTTTTMPPTPEPSPAPTAAPVEPGPEPLNATITEL